ncbi:unnamed protein product [Callosobruchus maculatus]|uniref:Uncharacterized protein n=1 Tax=Callosobruchus maculatus TaxID=64391 RepID=A0A653BFU3_CALMS|nr:unnamed protein product [Callosobruchus maculatus]
MAVAVAINLEVSQSPSQIMYKTIATLAVAIFALIHISNAAVPGAVDLRSMFPLREPSNEIISGDCTNATKSTLVYTEHVYLVGNSFTTRKAEVQWIAKETIRIYCVMALSSKKKEAEGSTVEIEWGGVGHDFVILKMESALDRDLDYNVQVFGKLKR